MSKITDIRAQKNKKRFNIYLDQKFAFPLSAEELVKSGLEIGQEISEEDIRILRYKDTKGKLYERVLRFLSYRPRSEKEVRDYAEGKLATRKTPSFAKASEGKQKLVDEVIEKLKKQKLIDDREFARWWLGQRSRFRPRGKIALKIELKRKGVSQEIIEKIINQKVNELVLAKKAIKKKVKGEQKITQYLARRGFSWETIRRVLAEISKKR